MEFEDVVAELYALQPEEFIAVREQRVAQARGDGDRALAKRIHELRRPTLAAWAINLLVREQPPTADQILSLGAELRQAWAAADGEQLRELSARRHEVVYALAQLVRRLAYQYGRPLSEDAAEEVQTTLDGALADPEIAREVCSGRLVRARSYAGFGPGEAPPPPDAGEEAAARPAPDRKAQAGRAKQQAAGKQAGDQRAGDKRAAEEQRAADERREAEERRAAARRQAERERLARIADEAAEAAEEAETELAAAAEAVTEAEQRRAVAEAEIARLTAELDTARDGLTEAQRTARQAIRDRDRLTQRAQIARRRADRAKTLLEAHARTE